MPNLVRPIVYGKNIRIFQAYLAEAYDGIGQFVAISLSRNAVTSALRAKILGGDFIHGTHYPQGVPVLVFTHHGQIAVIGLGTKVPVNIDVNSSA